MIRLFRPAPDFDEAVLRYARARMAWEDSWGPDHVDLVLHRLLHVAERLWSFVRPPVPVAAASPDTLPPQVIKALSNPTIARLLSSPRGALALARLIEREERRLARGVARPLDPEALIYPERTPRGPERDFDPPGGDLRAARSARFARARPLHEYAQDRAERDPLGETDEDAYPEDPPELGWGCDPDQGCAPAALDPAPSPARPGDVLPTAPAAQPDDQPRAADAPTPSLEELS